MKINLTVQTPLDGVVHIFHPDDKTLAVHWDNANLNSFRRSRAENYLCDEGFFDEAMGKHLASDERKEVEALIASVEEYDENPNRAFPLKNPEGEFPLI